MSEFQYLEDDGRREETLHEQIARLTRERDDYYGALLLEQERSEQLGAKLAEAIASKTGIADMSLTDGGLTLAVRPPREMLAILADALAGCIDEVEAPNYVEIEADHPTHGPLVLTVQKKRGVTPHQARKAAEAERDEMKAHHEQSCDVWVAEMQHWKARAEAAEAERDRLLRWQREAVPQLRIADLYSEHPGRRRDIDRLIAEAEGKEG